MKSVYLFATLFTCFTLASCNNSNKQEKNTETTITSDNHHNAQNSLDWDGTYSNDSLTVTLRKDQTYTRSTATKQEAGEFAWDTEGNIIALVDNNGEISLLKVEENRLTNGDNIILIKQQ